MPCPRYVPPPKQGASTGADAQVPGPLYIPNHAASLPTFAPPTEVNVINTLQMVAGVGKVALQGAATCARLLRDTTMWILAAHQVAMIRWPPQPRTSIPQHPPFALRFIWVYCMCMSGRAGIGRCAARAATPRRVQFVFGTALVAERAFLTSFPAPSPPPHDMCLHVSRTGPSRT